jgi:exopolysaccharide biosynthesis polyprenyl glycosylphosphotransferase
MFEIFRSVRLRRLFLSETLLIVLVAVLMVRLRIGVGFPAAGPTSIGLGPAGALPLAEEWPYWVEALIAGITIPVAVQIAMYYFELYSSAPLPSRTQVLSRLLVAHIVAGVALALLYYLVPKYRVQRLALAMTLAISSWLLFSLRYHAEEILFSGTWRRRVLLLGTGPLGRQLARDVLARPGSGYELAGFLSERVPEPGSTLLGRPILGAMRDAQSLVERHEINDVVFAPDEQRGHGALMMDLVSIKARGTAVWSPAQFIEMLLHRLPVEMLRPSEFIFDPGFRPTRFGLAMKRLLDVVFSIIALLLVAPIMLITAIAIRIDSPGPVFYRQQRVGKGGKLFTIIKFRSMRVQKPGEQERLTAKSDDRITRVGRFIRLHRIDELPQFLCVLIGDMSLVGPRPEVPYSVEELKKKLPFYDQRHALKPGVTSLGQVRYGAATTLDEARERLKYDLYYQKNMSLAFDLSILLDTVKVVLLKTGAR